MRISITASPRFILSISFVALFFAFAFPLLVNAGSQTYSTPGTHTFTVPTGITSINVTLKGAGGGTGCFYQSSPGSLGGSGGRTQGTLSVTLGQTLSVMVGGAGSVGNCTAAGDPARVSGGYGGGGKSQNGGSGGGRSAIFSSSNTELMAAGGGGGGGNSGIVNGHWWCTTGDKGPDDCPGGNGGGTAGADGVSPSTKLGNYTYTGHGGTQTAAGVCPTDGSISGSGHNGGNTYFSAGGGGGGWYGGSGSCDYGVGGGGGGSGHCNSSTSSCTTSQGSGSPGGTNGEVVISWTSASSVPTLPACNATTDPTKKTTGTSGSQTFSTTGDASFTVPQYDGTLKIEVWGGGGGASGSPYFHNIAPGGAGQQSSAHNLIANGGLGGTNASRQGPWWVIYVPSSGGAGGTASGGTINTTGGVGGAGFGGASPFGGAGGNASSIAGKAPGGGGGGTSGEIGGGGGGGYSSITYTPSQLTKGTSIPVTVGAGGVPGDANVTSNGSGAPGAVKFTWTATGQTLSLCSAGYTLKNGKCVSTAVCATCPAGQTLKTIPGARIAATSGGGGTPGSQTYSTPGTHTFTVPANYQSLTVTVNGAGGGGSGAVGNNGEPGGKSSFKNTMIGNGGEGGVWDGGGAPKAANGSASGGNISNVTGGGAAGGVSARGTTYGVGGSGGQAKSTYASGDLPASVTVVVGAGGAPEPTAVSLGGGGKAGSNGSVTITWTGGSSLSCPTGYTLQGSECVAPDTTQCVPDTTCPAGYHFDLITNQCVINGPTVCIAGYHLDTATNQCVPDGVTLEAAPTAWGFASLIHWDASDANSCTGTGFNTNGATSGTVTTDPLLQTTTFTLVCDTGTKSVTVVIDSCPAGYVGTPPVCTLASNTCPAGYTGTPPNCSVASSCPLNYTGTPPNCTPIACVPTNICNGNNVVNSCTGALIQSCAYSCASGACIVPPPSVVSWTVAPLIVNQGTPTNVSWEVRNVSSCSVSGTNGDSWTGLTGTKVSGPINAQTIFTLHCIALAGSGAPNVTRTATVNIVPVFQEK